jgi:hypothetical protein
VGATSFTVVVNSPAGLLDGAMVCAMNDEIYATALTDSAGQATLTFNPAPTQTGIFTLTITTSNSVPHIAEIDILPAGGSDGAPISGQIAISPDQFNIVQVNPNPFNPATALSFQLSADSHVELNVFDLSGRLVATPANGWQEAGSHRATFDGSDLPSGIYVYHLTVGNYSTAGKMILMK